jgi:predicted HicB family RNase H-like nuclease
MKANHYLKIVEWSEEDGCYVGTCPEIMLGGVHGKNEVSVYRKLCAVLDEWIEIYEKDGKPLPPPTAHKTFPGKFILRMGQDLHKALALAALRRGESLNQFCIRVLKKKAIDLRLHARS